MTNNQKIKLLTLEIGHYLTRLPNHPDDGPERIGHCLGEMRLLGKEGKKRANDLWEQITDLITANAPTTH